MRKDAKVDANQPEIIRNLRKLGATVQPLHVIGKGCPDLLVGYKGENWLFELKDRSKPPSKRKLTLYEKKWHKEWGGQVDTAMDIVKIFEVFNKKIRTVLRKED